MLKKCIHLTFILMACFVFCGCSNNKELIAQASNPTRSNVFVEITNSDVPQGRAIADIKYSVKSNKGDFAGTYYKHSNPPYRVDVNIDGQVMMLDAEPVLEDKSPINDSIPESGVGWKYQFSKRIALAPGKHNLKIALPVDGVIVEREIDVRSGINSITLTPVYNTWLLHSHEVQTFKAGVKTVEIVVD